MTGALFALILATITGSPGRYLAAEPAPVAVTTSLDRTAVWVGDRVTYTIALTCRHGIDILPDDLSRDKLKLEGLDIVGNDSDRVTDRDDVTTYRFRYYLTTYRVDAPSLTVAPPTVRYYVKRAGQRLEDTAPAGEVHVPAAVVAFRSVLPDDPEAYALREGRPAAPRPRRFAVVPLAGLALILLSIVPAAFFVVAIAARARHRGARRSPRRVRHDERTSLEQVRAMDLATPESRRDAYARVDALVRAHLETAFGVPAPALTPEEIGAALSARGARVPDELVTSLLTSCDVARYSSPEALPSADACRRAIEQSEEVLASRR